MPAVSRCVPGAALGGEKGKEKKRNKLVPVLPLSKVRGINK